MKNIIARFIREEDGQDLIEYALLGTFVALAAVTGLRAAAGGLESWYFALQDKSDKMADCVTTPGGADCIPTPP